MYYILSILTGSIISVMVSINGTLSTSYGNYIAAVIIHIVGVSFSGIICLIKKAKFKNHAPLWAYLGGAFGVLTTFFNNYSFGKISMTSLVALGLLGQSITSVLLDSFGWLGIKKRKINKSSIIGYITAIIGFFIMLDNSISTDTIAVLVSLCAGVTVVLSRAVNSRLSNETSPISGSFINHLVGLPICIIIALFIHKPFAEIIPSGNPIMYLGGIFGVLTVLLYNIIVPKISALRLTLLVFVGQVFTGIIVDIILGFKFSSSTFTGGIVISLGLLINMILDLRNIKKC